MVVWTPKTEKWVSQFSDGDRPAARHLIDLLQFISVIEFRRGLQLAINRLLTDSEGPAVLVPVRETKKGYFEGTSRNAGAKIIKDAEYPGSEGLVAQLYGSIPSAALCVPKLSLMRDQRVRTILFVDDNIGSGKRLESFIDSFNAHRTIKSWRSLGLLKYHAVVYSFADSDRFEQLKKREDLGLTYIVQAPTLSKLAASPYDLKTLEWLCDKYVPRRPTAIPPLGYEGLATMLVFEHSVPNTVPKVFWGDGSNCLGQVWVPLFPQRSVGPDVAREMEARQGRGGSADNNSLRGLMCVHADAVRVLKVLRRRIKTLKSIAELAGVTPNQAESIIQECTSLGLVSGSLRLTDEGLLEVKRFDRLNAESSGTKLPVPGAFYYPRSLRRARTRNLAR